MLSRRTFAAALIAVLAVPTLGPTLAAAQATTPSAATIERQLDAAPRVKLRPNQRVTIREFKRRPDLRRQARSIDIQSINFAFGSAAISSSQYDKIENIADALQRILRRAPGARVLIEGHTDAVGTAASNLVLSDARAASVAQILTEAYHIPPENLATQGYGSSFLKIQTDGPERVNRRVVIRRITPLITVASSP